MVHMQEIAEDAVSTLQRADVVGKQNLSKQTSVLGHNSAKCIQTCLQYKKTHPSLTLTGEKFYCSYGIGQQAEVYGNAAVTQANIQARH